MELKIKYHGMPSLGGCGLRGLAGENGRKVVYKQDPADFFDKSIYQEQNPIYVNDDSDDKKIVGITMSTVPFEMDDVERDVNSKSEDGYCYNHTLENPYKPIPSNDLRLWLGSESSWSVDDNSQITNEYSEYNIYKTFANYYEYLDEILLPKNKQTKMKNNYAIKHAYVVRTSSNTDTENNWYSDYDFINYDKVPDDVILQDPTYNNREIERLTYTSYDTNKFADITFYTPGLLETANKHPSVLSIEYKTGDILLYKSVKDKTIINVFVVGPLTERCKYEYFIEHPTYTDIFKIKMFDVVADKAYTQNHISLLYDNNKSSETKNEKEEKYRLFSNQSMMHNMTMGDPYILTLGQSPSIMSEDVENKIYVQAVCKEKIDKKQHQIVIKTVAEPNATNKDAHVKKYASIDVSNASIESDGDTSIEVSDVASKILKVDSMFVKDHSLNQNVDGASTVYSIYMITDDEGFVYIPQKLNEIIDDNVVKLGGTLNKDKFIQNSAIGYMYGYELYEKSQGLISTKTTNEPTLDFVIFPKTIDTPKTTSYEYYLQTFCMGNSGVKTYSRTMNVHVDMQNQKMIAYQAELVYNEVEDKEASDGVIEFIQSPITCDDNDECTVRIQKRNDIEGDITIKRVKINNKPLSVGKYNWFSVTNTTTNVDNDGSQSQEIVFNISNNIPITNNTKQTEQTEQAEQKEYTDLQKYINSYNDDCEDKLFNPKLSLPFTQKRSFMITVEYDYIDKKTEKTKQYIQNYKVTQPGLIDKRGCPPIKLNLVKDTHTLEQYNSIQKGVKCNQFVTYLDVEIGDMMDMWETYGANNSSELSFIVQTSPFDLDIFRSAGKLPQISDNPSPHYMVCFADNEMHCNYAKLSIELCDNDKINDDRLVYGFMEPKNANHSTQSVVDDANETVESGVTIPTPVSIDNVYYLDFNDLDNIVNNKDYYVFTSQQAMSTNDSMIYATNGHYRTMYAYFKGWSPKYINEHPKIRFKITFEMGNPIMSSLRLQFAVSAIQIKNTINDESNTFSSHIDSSTVLNENNLSDSLYLISQKTINSKNVDKEYRFASKTLYVTAYPFSYTASPYEDTENMKNIQGTVQKIGDDAQIHSSFKLHIDQKTFDQLYKMTELYVQSLGESADTVLSDIYTKYGMFSDKFLLKKKYIQDNVGDIIVSTLSLSDTIKYTKDETHIDKVSDTSYKMLNGNKYLSLTYNANIMAPKNRDGRYTFYYNENLYEKDRYSQIENNFPILLPMQDKISIRTSDELSSMDVWNFQYLQDYMQNIYNTDSLFTGSLNKYADGYMYLKPSVTDETSYGDDVIPFSVLQEQNEQYLDNVNLMTHTPISIKNGTQYEPTKNGLFRAILYDASWQYPKYVGNDQIEFYQIVSDFDMYITDADKWYTLSMDLGQYPENTQTITTYEYVHQLFRNKKIIPYSMLFDIYPRVAYNTDTDSIISFMLRRPSINKDLDAPEENSTDTYFTQSYRLGVRKFELSDNNYIDIFQTNEPLNAKY